MSCKKDTIKIWFTSQDFFLMPMSILFSLDIFNSPWSDFRYGE